MGKNRKERENNGKEKQSLNCSLPKLCPTRDFSNRQWSSARIRRRADSRLIVHQRTFHFLGKGRWNCVLILIKRETIVIAKSQALLLLGALFARIMRAGKAETKRTKKFRQ